MRRLQVIAGVRHFGNQAANPPVQFQLQQAAILGRANVLPLDEFQIVSDARKQEDIRQPSVDTTVGRGLRCVIDRRLMR
ncbi:hypothetical protein D3C78_1496530 [compost metagenome]